MSWRRRVAEMNSDVCVKSECAYETKKYIFWPDKKERPARTRSTRREGHVGDGEVDGDPVAAARLDLFWLGEEVVSERA